MPAIGWLGEAAPAPLGALPSRWATVAKLQEQQQQRRLVGVSILCVYPATGAAAAVADWQEDTGAALAICMCEVRDSISAFSFDLKFGEIQIDTA